MSHTIFSRPTRTYPEPPPDHKVAIDAPPQVSSRQGLYYLYPFSGILIAALSLIAFGGLQHNPPIIAAEMSIILLSISMLFLSYFFQKRLQRERQHTEYHGYRKYLTEKRARLQEIKEIQDNWNHRFYPDPSDLLEVVLQRQYLWERRPSDHDFLLVRMGLAPIRLCCPIEFKQDEKIKYVPELFQEARELIAQYSHIEQQPVAIALRNLGTIVITGPCSAARGLLRAILCQIIAFHAPHEVRIGACFLPEMRTEWSWLRWLPHSRRLHRIKSGQADIAEPLCLLADNIDGFQEIFLTQIKPELERRRKIATSGVSQNLLLPHMILVLDGFTPDGKMAKILEKEELLCNTTHLGITIIYLIESHHHKLPIFHAKLTFTPSFGRIQLSYKEMAKYGKTIDFIAPDDIAPRQCEVIARSLAPLTPVEAGDPSLDFSQDRHLFELLHISSLDTLQIAGYWQRTCAGEQLLRIPIGQQKNGRLILDLKEMTDGGAGPHGMIVGATGSGKSELLRTIITGLALTHDPHMLNFVLIDCKAGATFADFSTLPHVAGIITNFENDLMLISRMHTALLGEQKRRQNMLDTAGNLGSIKQYQARWRRNPDMEPMPYLFIIVDEFAQLIANHEDFLVLFTSLGQAVGMHLLLSAQCVDEKYVRSLDGHLRYRICLRTFKPEESISVLGNSDAYYLPPLPGSGYFKVDNDASVPFKAALTSVPYRPAHQQNVEPVPCIRKFTTTGMLISYQRLAQVAESRDTNNDETDIGLNMALAHIAQVPVPATGWRVRPVWKPPLKRLITLYEVLIHCNQHGLDGSSWAASAPFGPLRVPLGMLDRPAEQVQEPIMLDFSGKDGHLIVVGAPQSGKSTLLCTIIASLMVTHSPSEVQLYGIDPAGGLLRSFEEAPHIGAICDKTDHEKIHQLIRRMRQIIAERERLFAKHGIENMGTYRQSRQQGELPNEDFGDVFLVIDNLGLLLSDFADDGSDMADDLASIVATGLAYGVHVIITANQCSEVPLRLRGTIGNRLELRLLDSGESEIDKKQAHMIPPHMPGCGLHQSRLFFQTAWPLVTGATPLVSSLQQTLDELIQRMRHTWKGPLAPQIPVLPQEVHIRTLPTSEIAAGIPIGLEEFRLNPMYVDLISSDPHFVILGDGKCGKTMLLRTWLRGIEQRYTPEQVQFLLIDYRQTLQEFAGSKHILTYATAPEEAREHVSLLKYELEERNLHLPVEQLYNPQPWTGLHYFMFVDDYEVVTTLSPQVGNPLNPLEGLLLSGREIGFHLVLARRITDSERNNYDPIFRSLKNMEIPGLIMRGDPTEGYHVLHKQSASDTLPTGCGYLVRHDSPPTLVQVASSEEQ